ncbi:MAG: hypothetical protein K2O28_01760 [Clostridia bacterium]|nr:hypothetical protein [Clostridia bacterium]
MAAQYDKRILWAVLGPVCGVLCIGLITTIVCLVLMFGPTSQSQRNEMTEYYRNSEYLTIYGKISGYRSFDREAIFNFELDEDCINSLTEEQLKSFDETWISVASARYEFPTNCEKVLRDNGFFDLMKTDERGYLYSEETVTIIVNHTSWYHEDTPYAVGLSVGDTVYLDFETGKELLIDYIQHDMY